MISHKHRCIFVHIPKTAGSTIEYIFWPRREDKTTENLWDGFIDEFHNKYQTDGLQHLLATQIQQEVGAEVFRAYFKFCFVRNPWAKTASQFRYMRARPDLRRYIGMAEDADFKTYLSLIQKKNHAHWEKQYHFIYDENGELLADFIGHFENLEHDTLHMLKLMREKGHPLGFRALMFALGIKKFPHKNKKVSSKKTHYSSIYDDESRQVVEEMYKRDIELFGYKFETVET